MKTIQSRALVLAVASMLGTAAHAQGSGNSSWGAYRSIVNPTVVDSLNRSTEISTEIRRSVENSNNTDVRTQVEANRTIITKTELDLTNVTPNVAKTQSIGLVDGQSAEANAKQDGHTQYGSQGPFSLVMTGAQGPVATAGKYGSPASADLSYRAALSNSLEIGGDNHGAVSLSNVSNQGGSMINNSMVGPQQSISAGGQTQVVGNDQQKRSATQNRTTDVVDTTVRD